MIILQELQIKNFRNIENVSLKGLKDLNIIIGPNNCGKTSILQCVNLLSEIGKNISTSGNYLNHEDKKSSEEKIKSISYLNDRLQTCKFLAPNLRLSSNESYFRKNRIEISYHFHHQFVEEIANKTKGSLEEIFNELMIFLNEKEFKEYVNIIGSFFDKNNKYKLTIKQYENSQSVLSTHLSLVLIKEVFEEIINDKILLVEDKRIERYKGTPLREYIGNKNLPSKVFNELIEFMQSIVDSQIKDYTQNSLDLIKEIKKGVKD